jgi:hypothetical protein
VCRIAFDPNAASPVGKSSLGIAFVMGREGRLRDVEVE